MDSEDWVVFDLPPGFEDWDALKQVIKGKINRLKDEVEHTKRMIGLCNAKYDKAYADKVYELVERYQERPLTMQTKLRELVNPKADELYKWFIDEFEEFGDSPLLDKYMSDDAILVLKTCLWCWEVERGPGFFDSYDGCDSMMNVFLRRDVKEFRKFTG